MGRKNIIISVAIVVVVAVGGYAYMNYYNMSAAPSVVSNKNTISYTEEGFQPGLIAIKFGESVTFTNYSNQPLLIGFGEHMNHAAYPDKKTHPTLGSGQSDTITFPSMGEFDYHNHFVDEDRGKVIVQ